MIATKFKIRIVDHPECFGLAFQIYNDQTGEEEHPYAIIQSYTIKKLALGEAIPYDANLFFDRDSMQTLMDDLWVHGIRPSEWPKDEMKTIIEGISKIKNSLNELIEEDVIK